MAGRLTPSEEKRESLLTVPRRLCLWIFVGDLPRLRFTNTSPWRQIFSNSHQATVEKTARVLEGREHKRLLIAAIYRRVLGLATCHVSCTSSANP